MSDKKENYCPECGYVWVDDESTDNKPLDKPLPGQLDLLA